MTAKIVKIMVVDGEDTDLHIDKPVYGIHLADVMECVKKWLLQQVQGVVDIAANGTTDINVHIAEVGK